MHAMKNSKRYVVRYLEKYCDANDIALKKMSDDWIFLLEKNGLSHVVFGYDIGLNSSTAHRVASDKAATYELLNANGVPALEHYVYLHPRYAKHLSKDGNWSEIAEKFETWGRDAVVKPNEGTGGIGIYRVRSNFEMEHAVQEILSSERSLSLSPFVTIKREIRVFILDNENLLAYEKYIPTVTGDGSSTIIELMHQQLEADTVSLIFEGNSQTGSTINYQAIPAADEIVPIHWKHNLGLGAKPKFLDTSTANAEIALALKAARSIGLRFGSVDLVETDQGQLLVLEANSGVMMEKIAEYHPDGPKILDKVYGAALSQIFPSEVTR